MLLDCALFRLHQQHKRICLSRESLHKLNCCACKGISSRSTSFIPCLKRALLLLLLLSCPRTHEEIKGKKFTIYLLLARNSCYFYRWRNGHWRSRKCIKRRRHWMWVHRRFIFRGEKRLEAVQMIAQLLAFYKLLGTFAFFKICPSFELSCSTVL